MPRHLINGSAIEGKPFEMIPKGKKHPKIPLKTLQTLNNSKMTKNSSWHYDSLKVAKCLAI